MLLYLYKYCGLTWIFYFTVLCWLVMFLFKLNIFPVCFYMLDMYESLTFNLIFYLSAVMKVAVLLVFYSLYFFLNLSVLNDMFIMLGFLSLLYSNMMSIFTLKIKSFFGLTSINLNGFLLMCLTSSSPQIMAVSVIYLFIYNMSLYCFFGCFSNFVFDEKKNSSLLFSDLYNIFDNYSTLKFLLTVVLLVLSGMPPSILFIYKFMLMVGLMGVHSYFIMLLMTLLNLLSFFYYLNIMKDIWMKNPNFKSVNSWFFNLSSTSLVTELNSFNKTFLLFMLIMSMFFIIEFDAILACVEFAVDSLVF